MYRLLTTIFIAIIPIIFLGAFHRSHALLDCPNSNSASHCTYQYLPLVKNSQAASIPTATTTPTPTISSTPTSTITPTSSATPTFLPVATMTSTPTQLPRLLNGDFEAGLTGWYETPDGIIGTSFPAMITARSGNWAAVLNRRTVGQSVLIQEITIPADQPYLHYWYWISSSDDCARWYAGVVLNSTTAPSDGVDEFLLCRDTATTRWNERVLDLRFYSGRTVWLTFYTSIDSNTDSFWAIDDISFEASGTPSHPALPTATAFIPYVTPTRAPATAFTK